MFGPFSALAALGFTTGTLGFIVSTIPKINEDIRGYRGYQRSVRSFSGRLDVAYLDLRAWIAIWVGKEAFSNAFYIHLWSLDGLADVKSRLNDIFEESKEIEKLLYQPRDNWGDLQADSELREWQDILNDRSVVEILPLQQKESIIRKMIFALLRNDTLKEKIDGLEKSVDGLRKITQLKFRLMHDGDPGSKVTNPELRLQSLQHCFDLITGFGNSLYRYLADFSTFEWALELNPPGADHALNLWFKDPKMIEMYIDVIVTPIARMGHIKARRLRIDLEKATLQMGLLEQRIEEVFRGHDGPECNSEHNRIFDLLENPIKRSRALKKMLTDGIFSGEHRKYFEVERADLIYGLGHWMVLLWNTPWFSDLCTCGIRCNDLANANTRHSFLPRPGAGHMDRDSDCHPSGLAENRFELLGVRLAEIALALPISVDVNGYDIRSYVIKGESVSRERLLGMLKRQFGLNTITKAVSYCLGPDLAVRKDRLHPDHLEQYCRNIIVP